MPRDADQVRAPSAQLDHEQDGERLQSRGRPHLDREEVRASDLIPVAFQERPPGRRPIGSRLDPVLLQDVADGRRGDAVPNIHQRALDPAVAPAAVLPGEPDDQLSDLFHEPRPSHSFGLVRPLRRDQPMMPAKERVRRHDRRHLHQ
jgi:hypothetical protein